MICVSISESDFSKCLQKVHSVPFAEIRLDAGRFTLEQIGILFSQGNKTIATFRPGIVSDEERLSGMEKALRSGALMVDIEMEAPENYRKELLKIASSCGTRVIISYHNFEFTPIFPELEPILRTCFSYGADIAKIACQCNKMQDTIELLRLYTLPGRKLIIGMGELGKLTRISAPLLGAEFTFASLIPGTETAPGQLSLEQLKQVYNILNFKIDKTVNYE